VSEGTRLTGGLSNEDSSVLVSSSGLPVALGDSEDPSMWVPYDGGGVAVTDTEDIVTVLTITWAKTRPFMHPRAVREFL